ncbi:MAG: aminopeptidase P family protein [Alphaproteobacteria bacterium]
MPEDTYRKRLDDLRVAMKADGLDGFLLPRADRWPGEFVSGAAERLMWLTGFTGSAGTGVILKDKAAVFTDGRYTLQLAAQVDGALYEMHDIAKTKMGDWIAAQAGTGSTIGLDPWLYTPDQMEVLRKVLTPASIELKALDHNLVAETGITGMRPAEIFPESIAGRSSAEKKQQAGAEIVRAGAEAFIIAMPDSIAWLLNIRGHDIEHTPVILSHGILFADGKRFAWFVDPARIPAAVRMAIGEDVEIIHPESMEDFIGDLSRTAKTAGRILAIDFARTPLRFKNMIEKEGAEIVNLKDPCILPKAMKTLSEQDSIRRTHIEDGAAMVRFLAWFEGEAVKGVLRELDVVDKLEFFRKQSEHYREPSFATISGYGPNGAIVHYRAMPETNLRIDVPGVLLLDSGGQYAGGTTDITRTIAIGAVDETVRHHFTLVLKGHIALACAKFTRETTGAQLDEIARTPLMAEGLNYSHGTGHGVGCYLSVHEEAASISPRGKDALHPGMLLSNEPGYYREGAYGIRIESLVLVKEQGEGFAFETVTLVPIDRALIDAEMLSESERAWLNEYHARVRGAIAPLVEPAVRAWLEQAAAPL